MSTEVGRWLDNPEITRSNPTGGTLFVVGYFSLSLRKAFDANIANSLTL